MNSSNSIYFTGVPTLTPGDSISIALNEAAILAVSTRLLSSNIP